MSDMRSFLCTKKSLSVLSVTLLVGSAAFATTALSDSLLYDFLDSCTTVNCNAVNINGISQRNSFGDSIPFTVSLFADVNQCIRLDVTSQSADMEIVLVSPSGSIWRNDDFNGTRPLITARGDVKGYYTVQVNFFNGAQAVNSVQLFSLAYGLYIPGTPVNCPSPAGPTLATQQIAK
jgi:hypothetical protein